MQKQNRQVFYANYYDETGAGDIIWRGVHAWEDERKISQLQVAGEALSNRTQEYDAMMSRLFPNGNSFDVGQIIVFYAELEHRNGVCYLSDPYNFIWY